MSYQLKNPFEYIYNELTEVKKLLKEIKNAPKEDYSNKYYTFQQVADLLHVNYQSVRNYVQSGLLNAKSFGPRKKLIHHYDIFNEDNTLKEFKYKRNA